MTDSFIKRIEKDLQLLDKKDYSDFFSPTDLSHFRFEADPITLKANVPLEFIQDIFDYIKYLKTKND
jgi:hypothetical protein